MMKGGPFLRNPEPVSSVRVKCDISDAAAAITTPSNFKRFHNEDPKAAVMMTTLTLPSCDYNNDNNGGGIDEGCIRKIPIFHFCLF
jgi:hypothetical protein